MVREVVRNSPAARVGFRAADLIVAIHSRRVPHVDELYRLPSIIPPDTVLEIAFIRDGELSEIGIAGM